MKKFIYLLICTLFVFTSCSDDNNDDGNYKTFSVTVQLTYPAESNYKAVEGVSVKLDSKSGSGSYEAKTDGSGKAVLAVPAGIYDISATERRFISNQRINFNGIKTGLVVNDSWTAANIQELELQFSKSAQIVIKELYVGGCPKDDGSGTFNYDKYVVLYNNSEEDANVGKMALAMTMPYNSTGTNNYYDAGGQLTYANQGWIPAGQGLWYFQQDVVVSPGKQIVVALSNAVNNTITYSKSINFDNPEYYCTYDNTVYTHALTYPAPAASIPTSHYLKAVSYGAGTAWALSALCPAFYLFTPDGTTVKDFANDASKNDSYGGSSVLQSKKVPLEWITDGIEVFTTSLDDNRKRLTSTVDAGYVYYTNKQGYSVYRNVDKEATEAIEGNKAKLIYGYNLGTTNVTKGSTDPSGIDAEASIKNGARIIYKDTNNSSEDFHQRSQASLRK
ncbi:DUF4876 domain-containing protein [Dysgonomonas sp. Marseille-P4677]|nr:DUF4876 domain-containing protein [Dysgonomonas sp. Marseille-P4677]